MDIKGIEGIVSPLSQNNPTQAAGPAKADFAESLSGAMKEIGALQSTADSKVEAFVKGGEGVSPHEAMISLEKADLAFQLMAQVKAKIVRAYEEVMRMQV